MSEYRIKIRPSKKVAINAVCFLAMHKNEYVTIKSISDCLCVSVSYIEQLFKILKNGGIISSKKGPGGGYKLANPSYEISVYSVLHCVSASFDCELDDQLTEIDSAVNYVLDRYTEIFELNLKSTSIMDIVGIMRIKKLGVSK